MTRNQYRIQSRNLFKRMDEAFVGSVYKALRRQYLKFFNDLKQGREYARSGLNAVQMSVEMGRAVERIHTTAGRYMANRTLSTLKKNKGMQAKYATFGFNDEWVADILNFFRLYLLEKAVIKVSETTRDKILSVLDKATTEGWSNDQIVKELSDLQEIRGRARMIVRTETVRAANYGVLLGADKYEYETVKEWVSVPDNRRRHSHATVEGQQREIGEPFSNGLQFPGDPNGPAKETINCRCVLVMVAKRDERGRLIPKRNTVPTTPMYQRVAA